MKKIQIRKETFEMLQKCAAFGMFKAGSYDINGNWVSFQVSDKASDALRSDLKQNENFDDIIARVIQLYHGLESI